MIENNYCFCRVCLRKEFRVNEVKSNVRMCGDENTTVYNLEIQRERMKEVHEFKYLGYMINYKGTEGV